MSHHKAAIGSHHDRRKATRHYLTRPLRADLIWGRQRVAIESAAISDVSENGVGLRVLRHMKAGPQGNVTVAVAHRDRVFTLAGKVAAFGSTCEVGVMLPEPEHNPLLDLLAGELESASVSLGHEGKAHVAGKLTIAARHAVKWAIESGVKVLHMKDVTALDASAIGMLLKLNERDGIKVDDCPQCVCRMVRGCALPALCSPDCARARA
jgi:hypothetical protein